MCYRHNFKQELNDTISFLTELLFDDVLGVFKTTLAFAIGVYSLQSQAPSYILLMLQTS